jgi:hypothetical protein
MPRKEFESFTRLDASDVNTYLMDQSVQSFAGTAARGSAIATPVEGMVTYLNDINSLSVYNGTAFTTDRTIQVFAGTAARGSAIGTAVEGMYTHINDTDSLEYYNGSAWVAAGGGGAILQVKSILKTDIFEMSSGTFADVTGLSVSITPSSATSKILVNVSVNGQGIAATSALIGRILRDSTAIAIGDADGSRTRATFGNTIANGGSIIINNAVTFLDNPATTSAITYSVQVRSDNPGQLVYVNRSSTDTNSDLFARTISTITVMEVAA